MMYCLQPLTVYPEEDAYYVIDGQQRLTVFMEVPHNSMQETDILGPFFRDTIEGIVENAGINLHIGFLPDTVRDIHLLLICSR